MEASRWTGAYNASVPFIAACGSGMVATVCVQPIDTVKVRMQLMEHLGKKSLWATTQDMVARGGVLNLYQGLSAGLLRQVVYGTMRLGLFATFERLLEQRAQRQGSSLGFGGRAVAGLSAGAIAALVGTPTEVALIRMQADGMKPTHLRSNYTSAFDALRRIAADEGVLALWKGARPTVIRAMSTNFGQLAFFSESKQQLHRRFALSRWLETGLAATIAGFAGAFFSLPFDFVKTRLQNQTKAVEGGLPLYKGTWDCFAKVAWQEGPLRFYRGFWPYVMRIVPHS